MTQDNPNVNAKQKKLKVSITRTYGKVTVEYGIEEVFELTTPLEQKEAFAKLRAICEFEHAQHIEDFKRNPIAHGQAAEAPPQQPPASTGETEPVLEIALNINNGEKQFRVKTPKSHQYGYPIYEDCPSFATFLSELGGAFSAKPVDYVATSIPQGKGRKIVSFEKKF